MKCLVLDAYFSAILQYNINNILTLDRHKCKKDKKIILSEKIKDDKVFYDLINCGASY
jgi:hypothetical protein